MKIPCRPRRGQISILGALRIFLQRSAPAEDYHKVFQGVRGTPADMRQGTYVCYYDTRGCRGHTFTRPRANLGRASPEPLEQAGYEFSRLLFQTASGSHI